MEMNSPSPHPIPASGIASRIQPFRISVLWTWTLAVLTPYPAPLWWCLSESSDQGLLHGPVDQQARHHHSLDASGAYLSPPPTGSLAKLCIQLPYILSTFADFRTGGIFDSSPVLRRIAQFPLSPPPTDPTSTLALPPTEDTVNHGIDTPIALSPEDERISLSDLEQSENNHNNNNNNNNPRPVRLWYWSSTGAAGKDTLALAVMICPPFLPTFLPSSETHVSASCSHQDSNSLIYKRLLRASRPPRI